MHLWAPWCSNCQAELKTGSWLKMVNDNPQVHFYFVSVWNGGEDGRRPSVGGLLARAVQHETDHLHGILFIDRMDKKTKTELQPELDALQAKTKAELKKGK